MGVGERVQFELVGSLCVYSLIHIPECEKRHKDSQHPVEWSESQHCWH